MSDNFSSVVVDTDLSDVKILQLKGQLDELGIEVLKNDVDPLLANLEVQKIIFDFTEVTFINSKGIGYLVSIHTHLSKDGRILAIANANQAVMDVISLVGLTSIIPYFANSREALANL